ncbi:D-glycero-alpha-D-manno-heptose-1,7-bisphosphate 7-phosphatase [Rhodococcus pyridinivorans]|uniref:D,D-heptose 1,7-bisphosphate phosphatase n=1 Tax=Rhodococcus pyridinivorans TaxID=103816 RepID=A0A7M2XVP5_9NOCA|nr:HAD family hydrolase [Rhodococcus pyridinivorans]QOW01839.1 HAD family hydrolase [Rhodococcus pyridinivorans]
MSTMRSPNPAMSSQFLSINLEQLTMTTNQSCVLLQQNRGLARISRPAVFLDRDGVVIDNCDTYVRHPSDVTFLPGVIDAVRKLSERRDVVIVTNQSVIGRGFVPAETILEIHQSIVDSLIAGGADITGSVICPHDPSSRCTCRKPEPGMLIAASQAWGCQLEGSWMVGDALTDIQAGAAVGCQTMLVRTGRGEYQEHATRLSHPECVVVPSLLVGVDRLLADPTNAKS